MAELKCTCDPLAVMTVCHDIRNEPHLVGCPRWGAPTAIPVVMFDGGEPPHRVHYPTRPGWRWGWCSCPIGEDHNENAVSPSSD